MIEFKIARAADAEALLKHIKAVGRETDFLSFDENSFEITPEREAKFIERFYNNKNELMLVACDGDKIVGNGILEAERIPRYSHRKELSVTVLREYWGQGIGSELMRRLLDFAKQSAAVVSLVVRSDNERAISLYRKFGFREVGKFEKYFKIKDSFYDALIMQICL